MRFGIEKMAEILEGMDEFYVIHGIEETFDLRVNSSDVAQKVKVSFDSIQDELKKIIEEAPASCREEIQDLVDGDDIPVLPFSICYNSPLYKKLFNPERFPAPEDFTEEELKKVSSILWTPAQYTLEAFDFSNPKHLCELYEALPTLKEKVREENLDESSTLVQFLNTARAYENLAQLEPLHKDILDWKVQKKSNSEIQSLIQEKYNHLYQVNYISTLYHKVFDKIAETASFHKTVCENLFFPENFKKCKDCGRSLLLTDRDWVKRQRSRDGFSPRCKHCEKIKRNLKGGK